MKVMKIGGGCLKDVLCFHKVAEILQKETDPTVLVVSAISGVTNILSDGILSAKKSENTIPDVIKKIQLKHRQIIDEIISDSKFRNKVLLTLERKIEKLEKLFFGIAFTNEISDSVQAQIVSYGERLAAITLAAILESFGIKAIAKEADDIGIITDDSFYNATALIDLVKENLANSIIPLIKEGITPIITGYFGCSKEGKTTTFGRNGTDYSSAVIASVINANALIIWKDVDGFMSADPKMVLNARKIDQLSFYEAAELSYFGAKILHPRTLEPLLNKTMKISIQNIDKPNAKGTTIDDNRLKENDVVKSVTYSKEISVLKILGPGVGCKPGIIGLIGNNLANIGINIYSVITSQTCINLLVNSNDATKSKNELLKLVDGVIKKVTIEDDIALIAVVGEGVLRTKGIAAKVFSAVANQNINIEMISAGASEVAYYFIVKEIDLNVAINSVHKVFFEQVH